MCPLSVPRVPIVPALGRVGHLGRSSRYQSGTTGVAASNPGPDSFLATTHGSWSEYAWQREPTTAFRTKRTDCAA